jgi:hypothetical protein
MLKTFAIIFGLILLIIGIAGFVPSLNPRGLLLGIFHVNLAHNILHLATGLIAILCGFASLEVARIYFQIFGVLYALVALLGFYFGNKDILGILANNHADNWLHVIIAVICLYLGFGYRSSTRA